MANITVRHGQGGSPQLRQPTEWNPFRAMRDLFRWDPFQEMAPMPAAAGGAMTFAPDFEVKETKDSYQFTADLPGIKEKDLEVTSTGNRLTVSGKRDAEQQEKTDTYFLYERSYGSFTRAFTLPEGIDAEHIKAELKDGVLKLVVPKKPEAMPKKITVQAGEKPKS
jgi:HSP20 family protein